MQQYGLFGESIANIPMPKDKKITLRDVIDNSKAYHRRKILNPLSIRHTGNYAQFDNSGKGYASTDQRFFYLNGKSGTLSKSSSSIPKFESGCDDYCFVADRTICEKLQTVPVDYTKVVAKSKAFEMLGNGWTVDVIAHIFSFMKF